jgi:hypothetical protein
LDHVSRDLATGAAGGWDVSIDRLHGKVIGARFAGDATVKTKGLALPIIVPHVGGLDWETVAKVRRMKEIDRLRGVLREVEAEAFEVASSGGDLEAAMRKAYLNKLSAASSAVHGISSTAKLALTELVVGAGAGYAMTGLTLLGPLAGSGITATFMTGLHVRKIVRERRQRAWIGVMDAISQAAP